MRNHINNGRIDNDETGFRATGRNMINKLRQLEQDLIGLADPLLCRTFLPVLQNYLNVLVRRVSKPQLQQMSDMISAIREMMLHKVPAGVEHFHPKVKRPDLS